MSDFINETPAARDWTSEAIQRHSSGIFGKLVPAVIWSDARNTDGQPLVDVDPETLTAHLTKAPLILLHNHDPGKPKGQVLEIANFKNPEGQRFAAAILGFYAGGAF
ncbi:hypothetical protein [Rhodoferax sp. BLA1]|uniref:hypothetical protein n=1 Tax=Rhodoferax sp. BLA1 TaxID=2576062 RepID=UPI001C553FCB|nr:hypothetical protein [Rhodoferax sp. BLA1]